MSAIQALAANPAAPSAPQCRRSAGLQPSARLAPSRPCSSAACFRRAALRPLQQQRRAAAAAGPRAEGGSGGQTQQKQPFGYTRKDVMLIGGGLIGAGYALYYGLQVGGSRIACTRACSALLPALACTRNAMRR